MLVDQNQHRCEDQAAQIHIRIRLLHQAVDLGERSADIGNMRIVPDQRVSCRRDNIFRIFCIFPFHIRDYENQSLHGVVRTGRTGMDKSSFDNKEIPLLNGKMLMVNHIDSAAAGHVDQLGHILVQMKGISLIRQVVIQVNPADIR